MGTFVSRQRARSMEVARLSEWPRTSDEIREGLRWTEGRLDRRLENRHAS